MFSYYLFLTEDIEKAIKIYTPATKKRERRDLPSPPATSGEWKKRGGFILSCPTCSAEAQDSRGENDAEPAIQSEGKGGKRRKRHSVTYLVRVDRKNKKGKRIQLFLTTCLP